ncbi:hypothetical protein [Actinocrispum sp. NPDC049592]|uniref:hypothetical protein n=1 Tax=Actinocrispum sp. NPDC049592 TaxID=3154835 RepID=UPI0034269036
MEERTVDELITAADGMSESVAPVLARLREQAEDDGVRVTVDVNGKLVDLDVAEQAMRLAPAELSALIRRLTTAAANAALAEGVAALANVSGTLAKAALTAPARPEATSEDDWPPRTWQIS